MSKYHIILFIVFALCFPNTLLAQDLSAPETFELDDVIMEMDSQEEQIIIFPEEALGNESVTVNPIEEAAPKATNTPVQMPKEIIVEPQTPLKPPVETTQDIEPVIQAEPTVQAIPYSGLYYDADSIGGGSELGRTSPRQVDPKYEPGSRFVVVEKGSNAGSTQAQLVAAQRALKLGRYASALDLFENLYKKTPNSRPVLMGLAVAQQNNGFTESAIATYEELLALEPNNIDATVNMLGLMKKRYPAVAYRRLKDLWEGNAENPAIAAQIGLTSAAMGNSQEALRFLGIAASFEPNNASHYYNMAVLSDRAGASKDALDLYQRALEVDVTHGGGKTIPREEIYDRLAFLRRQ